MSGLLAPDRRLVLPRRQLVLPSRQRGFVQQILLAQGGSGGGPGPDITHNQTLTSSRTGTSPWTLNLTVNAGTNLGMFLCIADDGANSSIFFNTPTWNGVDFNGDGPVITNAFDARVRAQIWALSAPATGNHDLVMSWTPTSAIDVVVGVILFNNVNQTSANSFGGAATNEGNSSSPTLDVTSATGEMVIDSVCAWNQAIGAVGAGQTQHYNTTIASLFHGAGSREAGAGTVTMSWGGTLESWVSAGISVKRT